MKSDKTDKNKTVKKTEKKKQLFLSALREKGVSVIGGCKIAGVGRQYMYQLRAQDPSFSMEWDKAVETGKETLKDMAYDVVHRSLQEGDKTVAMFVLRRLSPEVWDRGLGGRGSQEAPVEMTHTVSPRFAKVMQKLLSENEDTISTNI